jgi:hypothetical protein
MVREHKKVLNLNKKHFGLILLLLLYFSTTIFASTITRSLPDSVISGQRFTVTLAVTLTNSDDYYLLEEKYPSQFIASNPSNDGGLSGGAVKWVELQGATSTILTYELVAPQEKGTYSFSGKYYVGHGATSSQELTVDGETTISVSDSVPNPPNPPNPPGQDDSNIKSNPLIQPRVVCGDSRCDSAENCSNCSSDCGKCKINTVNSFDLNALLSDFNLGGSQSTTYIVGGAIFLVILGAVILFGLRDNKSAQKKPWDRLREDSKEAKEEREEEIKKVKEKLRKALGKK